MKRQSVSTRRVSGESEQAQVHESKRLKTRHNAEVDLPRGSVEDTGSGSSTEEDFHVGHSAALKHLAAEGISMQSCPENGSISDVNLNGSMNHTPSEGNNPIHNNELNGDGNANFQQPDIVAFEQQLQQQQQHSNGFENNLIDPQAPSSDNLPNILPNSSADNVASGGASNLENPENVRANNADYPAPPILQPEVEQNQMDYSQPDISDECNRGDETSESSSAPVEQSGCEQSKVSSLDQQEASTSSSSSSSLKESHSLNMQSVLSSRRVDVDNITLCRLNVTELVGHADVVFSVAADKDFILSSSGDTTVKVWNVESGAEICNFGGHHGAVSSVILLSTEQSETLRSKLNCFQTSRIAVSASYDCHIRVWSVLEGHEILSMYTFNPITCMGYLEELMYVVIGTEGGKLEVWDLHQAKLVHSVYAHDLAVSSLEVHDTYVYSASKDGAVKVWLFEEGELQHLYTRRRRETNISSSLMSPTQWKAITVHKDRLFLGDNTSSVKSLDWRIGRLKLFMNQQDSHGICEAVLARNNILFTSFYDSRSDTGGVNVWKLPEITYVATLTGNIQEICSLAVFQQENFLRIVSGGHQLVVWDFDFTNPPNKNATDPFFVCEVENIGSEIDEKSVPLNASKQLLHETDAPPSDKKKSWCSIS